MPARLPAVLALVGATACATPAPEPASPPSPPPSSASAPAPSPTPAPAAAPPPAVTAAAPPELRAPPAPRVSLDEARAILPDAPRDCADIECLLERAYARDAKARDTALALFRESGHVAGVGPEETMDGGYRGKIRLVPELPIGRYRPHLTWTADSLRSIDGWFDALFGKLDAGQPAPAYRWRALQLRFVRSVGKRTPSAYAMGWLVEYNVEGSLLTSFEGVRETLFHEIFHSNDGAHGGWSARALRTDYDAILDRCGPKLSNRCLAPYAPNNTMVRGGLYYAFQQNNGDPIHEYAAELAVRYWKEQSEMLAARRLSRRAFKCGPAENARAWKALVDEFFGGRDLTPAC